MKKIVPTFTEFANEGIKAHSPKGQKLIDDYSKYGFQYDFNIDGLYYHGTIAGAPTEIYVTPTDEENESDEMVLSITIGERTVVLFGDKAVDKFIKKSFEKFKKAGGPKDADSILTKFKFEEV